MATILDEGCIEAILKNGEIIDGPVLQLLNYRKISSASGDRYQAIISDGKHYFHYSMLTTQLNDKIMGKELTINSVIRLDQYVCVPSCPDKGKILVILDLTILEKGDITDATIGNPEIYINPVCAG